MMSLMSWYDNLPEGSIGDAATALAEKASNLGKFVVDLHKGTAFTGNDVAPSTESKAEAVVREAIVPADSPFEEIGPGHPDYKKLEAEEIGLSEPNPRDSTPISSLATATKSIVADGARCLATEAYSIAKFVGKLHMGTAFTDVAPKPLEDAKPEPEEAVYLKGSFHSRRPVALDDIEDESVMIPDEPSLVDRISDLASVAFDDLMNWLDSVLGHSDKGIVTKSKESIKEAIEYPPKELGPKATTEFILSHDEKAMTINGMEMGGKKRFSLIYDVDQTITFLSLRGKGKFGEQCGLEKVTISGKGRHIKAQDVLNKVVKDLEGLGAITQLGKGYRVDIYPHVYSEDDKWIPDYSKPPASTIYIEPDSELDLLS